MVKIKYYNVKMDYCILELIDANCSVALTPIPVSIQDLEAETNLKVYLAPIAAVNDMTSSTINIFTMWVKCARPTAHHIHCQGVLFGGSSGAPFILRNGRVAAFHLESFNSAETIDAEAVKQMEPQDAIELISETVNSNATSYGSICRGLYIA